MVWSKRPGHGWSKWRSDCVFVPSTTRWISSWQWPIFGLSVYVFCYLVVANSISRHHSPVFSNIWMTSWSCTSHWRQNQLSQNAPPPLSYYQFQDIELCFFSTNISKEVHRTFHYSLEVLAGAVNRLEFAWRGGRCFQSAMPHPVIHSQSTLSLHSPIALSSRYVDPSFTSYTIPSPHGSTRGRNLDSWYSMARRAGSLGGAFLHKLSYTSQSMVMIRANLVGTNYSRTRINYSGTNCTGTN